MFSLTLILTSFLVLSFLEAGFAGSVTEGSSCSPSNDRIDPSTHKFTTDCDDRTFCQSSSSSSCSKRDANATSSSVGAPPGTCVKKLCRNDEVPFGYADNEPLPPLCGRGLYCPDSGSGCTAILRVGSSCEMSRDYQCAPSKDWETTASTLNFNGSICLQSTCMYANVTIGLPCVLERTAYTGYDHNYNPYNITVSRDNCRSAWPYLYCGSTSSLCEKMKVLGEPCDDDRECLSETCNAANVCGEPPGRPTRVKAWQYAFTILSVLGVLSHKRQRIEHYCEVLEYYREQTSLRASIISLHTAAAHRLSSDGKIHVLQH
ncbi:hypothetical protein EW145_g5213 [Phellinidium pouzarii]|uniref:Dickkopf N-terminal cysteine-rich domain-containing protein n=1 Tax=Phellinidium pouzarii TaxID=167371 RepID=A0A4S4L103_9AGAM|nr:hypothetical protein EW145_g5213 [Phellinidium pouzarii]